MQPNEARKNNIQRKAPSKHTNPEIHKFQLTCWSKRVIYAIKCNKCHKTYVGQTLNPLQIRMKALKCKTLGVQSIVKQQTVMYTWKYITVTET